jgi:hypothetical protein
MDGPNPDRRPPSNAPGSIATYRYRLTRADALAFERRRPLGRRGSVVLVAWMLLAGVELGVIAGDWSTGWRFWLLAATLAAVHALVAFGVLVVLVRMRAARRVPAPIDMELEDRGDRLVVRGGGRELDVAFAQLAAVAVNPTHLVVAFPPATIIVPRTAFTPAADLAGLVARIEAAGRED